MRVDTPEVISFLEALHLASGGSGRLMNGGASGFRDCLNSMLAFFAVPSCEGVGITPASFRAGGATFWYRSWDDSERVRFRGRWMSHRMLEIYVQEVMVSTVMMQLP